MNISTDTYAFKHYGNSKEVISLLKNIGFDAFDYTMDRADANSLWCFQKDYETTAKELHEYAEKIGIKCNQTHAPFPSFVPNDETFNQKRFEELVWALHISSILGAKVCVVHPGHGVSLQENVDFYNKLLPYAEKYQVKIGVENMFSGGKDGKTLHGRDSCSTPEDYLAHMNAINSKWAVACVDVGHAELASLHTSASAIIKTLGNYCQALHLHDNDTTRDNHTLPFTREIDYEPIFDALAEINYQGDITFEASYFVTRFPKELIPSAGKLMVEVGKYFINQIENRKK